MRIKVHLSAIYGHLMRMVTLQFCVHFRNASPDVLISDVSFERNLTDDF